MGRWSHLDTDEERLPDGMTRVGYDGDTQVYTYQDNDGSYWEGAPGVKYGRLYRVQQAAPVLPSAWVTGDITGHEPDYVLHDYDSSPDENRPAPTSFSQIFGEDDDADSSSSDGSPTTPNEKRQLPRSTRLPSFPSKAVIHPSIKRKPVLNLPITTTNTTTNTADRMSIASTLVDRSNSLRSNLTTSTTTSTITSDRDRDRDREPPTTTRRQNGTGAAATAAPGGGGLRRSGTLSRLAQFLSTSTSGIARRATVTGEAGMAGHGHRGSGVAGRRRGGAASAAGGGGGAGAGGNGRWPAASPDAAGFGAGAGAGADAGGAARAARARKRATTFDDILGPGQ